MAARRKPDADDNASLVQDLDQFRRPQSELRLEPRKGRSKRGVTRDDPNTSQVCFRIEKDRHKALKAYCLDKDLEIGEILSDLVQKHLGI